MRGYGTKKKIQESVVTTECPLQAVRFYWIKDA